MWKNRQTTIAEPKKRCENSELKKFLIVQLVFLCSYIIFFKLQVHVSYEKKKLNYTKKKIFTSNHTWIVLNERQAEAGCFVLIPFSLIRPHTFVSTLDDDIGKKRAKNGRENCFLVKKKVYNKTVSWSQSTTTPNIYSKPVNPVPASKIMHAILRSILPVPQRVRILIPWVCGLIPRFVVHNTNSSTPGLSKRLSHTAGGFENFKKWPKMQGVSEGFGILMIFLFLIFCLPNLSVAYHKILR